MVMGEDQAGAAVACGVGDHLAKREGAGAVGAIMTGQMDAARLLIDMRDPKMFAGRVEFGEAADKKAPGCL